MAAASNQRKPVFFWQAAFILLPVAGLALFGLFSLRQDRVLAQQEANELGQSSAARLAQAISDETSRQLADYREANFGLQANRTSELGLSIWGWANGVTSNSVPQQIEVWQKANPTFDLATMPVADCQLNYPLEYAVPKMYSPSPEPPEWLRQLTAEQTRLWQSIEAAVFAGDDFSAIQSQVKKFADTQPAPGAIANVEYLLLLAQTRGMPDREAAIKFIGTQLDNSPQLTAAGLPIGQLICYQALRRLPDGAGLPERFVKNHTLAWAIDYRPSLLSPLLIAEAVRVARNTPSESLVVTLKGCWDAEEKSRQILENYYERQSTNTWTNAPFWIASATGKSLLLVLDYGYQKTNANTPDISRRVFIFSEAVLDMALNSAVRKSGAFLPAYAVAECTLGGETLILPRGQISPATNGLPVLGEAQGELKIRPLPTPAYPFQIRVLLAHPDLLYAHQRQRTWIFGALIVASALAAAMGLLGAYRSFRRQLELGEMKSNFVSSVSHELRAPIASVRLMAENLEHGKISEPVKQREYFRFIVQECRRLSALIENVLDFSRIEQARKQYEFEPTNVSALVQATVKLMEPYALEKDVRLILETAKNEGQMTNIEWHTDGRAIQQALVNLIDNAIKHSPRGEVVTVGVKIKNGEREDAATLNSQLQILNFFVADHGPGIPPNEHAKIFERFYRRGSELRRETQGVGIGLSIVKHIVDAHGGTISVQSDSGQGSRFTIELPLNHQGTKAQR